MPSIPCEGCPKTFLELLDSPTSYVAAAGKVVAVKSDETGLEFRDIGLSKSILIFDTINDAKNYVSTYYSDLISEPRLIYVKDKRQLLELVPNVTHDNTDTLVSYYVPSYTAVLKDAFKKYYYIGDTSGSGHHPADPITLNDFMSTVLPSLGTYIDNLFLEFLTPNHDISGTTSSGTVYTEKLVFIINRYGTTSSIRWVVTTPLPLVAKELFIFNSNDADTSIYDLLTGTNPEKKVYVWTEENFTISETNFVALPSTHLEVESNANKVVRLITAGSSIQLASAHVKGAVFIPQASGATDPADAVNFPIQYSGVTVYGNEEFVPEITFYIDRDINEYAADSSAYKILGRRRMVIRRQDIDTREDVVNVILLKNNLPDFYAVLPELYMNLGSGYYAAIEAKPKIILNSIPTSPLYYDVVNDAYYYIIPAGEQVALPVQLDYNAEAIWLKVRLAVSSNDLTIKTAGGTTIGTVTGGSEANFVYKQISGNINTIDKYLLLEALSGNVLIEEIKLVEIHLV